MENVLLALCLVLVLVAAAARWQTAVIQKRRRRHITDLMREREDIGRKRGELELRVEEAMLQERALSSDIRDFTHQLAMMEERLQELREEEAQLAQRREKRLGADGEEG